MSYFDPNIYNEDNLKEQDRKEIQFWREEFSNAMDNALDDVCGLEDENEKTLDKIKREIIEEYIECLKDHTESSIMQVIVSVIDNYDEDGGEEE